MNNETKRYDFAAPFVPSADPLDGLLQSSELENDLVVSIQLWDGARPGYLAQLRWNNELVGEPKVIATSEKPGDILTLLLAVDHLRYEGFHRLGFRATNPFSQLTNDSPTIPILIDRTKPGAALLAAMVFPDVKATETLTGLIPGYAYMSTGDIIQSSCNEIEGPSVTVQPENLTTTPVSIQFDRSFLDYLNSDEVSIGYRVTDRAGNVSIMSQLVTLTLQA